MRNTRYLSTKVEKNASGATKCQWAGVVDSNILNIICTESSIYTEGKKTFFYFKHLPVICIYI